MNSETIKRNIANSLKNFNIESLREDAKTLVNTLGYHSEFVGNDDMDNQKFDDLNTAADETSDPSLCICDWHSFFRILQVTDDEINAQIAGEHQPFKSKAIDDNEKSSYMFTAMRLTGETYTRTQLTNIARFIKRHIPQPTMIIFMYGADNIVLTLAIINQRPDKRNPNKQVLEKVTLIKDINLDQLNRAHIDILSELHLQSLIEDKDKNVTSFDTLHEAWEEVLNTEELNKDFYGDLEEWYDWARTVCKFPDKENKMQIIRMITRLLFIWFLKEKELVPPDIFTEKGARSYLKNFDMETSDYYQAILQNLFFATLNTPIPERTFCFHNNADCTNVPTNENCARTLNNSDLQDSNKYLYADLLRNGRTFLEHLKQVPFVNGGLFNPLDSSKETIADAIQIDCFTNNQSDRQKLRVPAKIFFKKGKGLFQIFSHYKFTVEENTPIEQEIALDPELLGQTFENLLGVHNPESEELARKDTGSYYTRSHVVEYMVNEALIAYFLQKVRSYNNDGEYPEVELRRDLEDLLAYELESKEGEVADHLIEKNRIESLMQAIDELTILDPAVGSGAFPMGILNKIVLILRKLDPKNKRLKQQQIELANYITDPQSREESHARINEIFSEENQYNNYGRKLYLIQNCIYGVDIQPIAVTIAKLRFFISLVIEQRRNEDPDKNYGIRPLPNLETKFVAANTLIGLNELHQPDLQSMLEEDTIRQLQKEIADVRKKHFGESDNEVKLQYIEHEKSCREMLVDTLATEYAKWRKWKQGEIDEQVKKIPNENDKKQLKEHLENKLKIHEAKVTAAVAEVNRIAQWEPYNQNATARFFDPEWMFGIVDGFDITIGNPPYVRADTGRKNPVLQERNKLMRKEIKDSKQYETLYEKWDLFIPFIERSYKFLKPNGFTTLIVSNAYCQAKYARKSQKWFLEKARVIRLDFCGRVKLFGPVGVRNVIFLFQRTDGSAHKPERRDHYPKFGEVSLLPTDVQKRLTYRTAFFPGDTDDQQFSAQMLKLKEICYISVGMVVNSDEKKAHGEFGLKDVVSGIKDEHHPKPFVEGKNIKNRWHPTEHKWLEWGTERAPALFRRQTFPQLYETDEKLISISMSASEEKMRVIYDDQSLHHNDSAYCFILWCSLAGVKNMSIQGRTRYQYERPKRPDLPKREELEKTSSRFSLKFLLGVMNSTVAADFLKKNRSHDTRIYPNDWKELPIPDISPEQQVPIIELVDKILDAKRVNINKNVSDLEKEIDVLVGNLYGLSSGDD